jgi:anthranilate phosphoribosyltransferase
MSEQQAKKTLNANVTETALSAEQSPISSEQLLALIRMQLPEAEAIALLRQLSPDVVTLPLLENALACMREHCMPTAIPEVAMMDCCGTGGSGLSHFNTSTTVALVLAAGGVPVVKFGNRGFSSASGSFDLLEQLGIGHQLNPMRVPDAVDACGIAFLFAPTCYPNLAAFSRLRKQLGQRTLFNFLGPLLNPVQPVYRLLGVSHAGMHTLMAQHLKNANYTRHAWLVHGQDGLDEVAVHGPSQVWRVENGPLQNHEIMPVEGCYTLPVGEHSPQKNLDIFNALLRGEDQQSVYFHMVCLNAAAGFIVAGLAATLEDGYREAQSLLKTGTVLHKLEQCRTIHEQFSLNSHAE